MCLQILKIICILYNQRDETYTMFFIIISALHFSGGFSAHHQELIKLYVHIGYYHAFLLSTAGVDGLIIIKNVVYISSRCLYKIHI